MRNSYILRTAWEFDGVFGFCSDEKVVLPLCISLRELALDWEQQKEYSGARQVVTVMLGLGYNVARSTALRNQNSNADQIILLQPWRLVTGQVVHKAGVDLMEKLQPRFKEDASFNTSLEKSKYNMSIIDKAVSAGQFPRL